MRAKQTRCQDVSLGSLLGAPTWLQLVLFWDFLFTPPYIGPQPSRERESSVLLASACPERANEIALDTSFTYRLLANWLSVSECVGETSLHVSALKDPMHFI